MSFFNFQPKPEDRYLNDIFYSFTLHPSHPNLLYKNSQLLGGLKEIFIKEYPVESTIFGPIYDSEVLIFVSGWRTRDGEIGLKLQIKTRVEFQSFQTYLFRKFQIPKIKLLIPETFTQYLNIVANFDHPLLKKDLIFLNFVGVISQIAAVQAESNSSILKKVFKNEYIYYQRQVVHHNNTHCLNLISRCLGLRHQEDFFLKLNSQTIVLYTKNLKTNKWQMLETIVLTPQILVRFRIQAVTEYFNMKISNGINFIMIAFGTFLDMVNFVVSLNVCLEDSGYLEKNRYFSFSIQRDNCLSKYYADGHKYFSDLCDALSTAQRQVCITDWMLTPYFLLKRPDDLDSGLSRLDKMLFKLADEKKVEIFILIYSEPMMLFHDSEYVEQYFEKNRRIHVIRHPDVVIPILWSHHQKMVIIDEKVAFMGGLDITYGRWDTPQHCIIDHAQYWPGRDYRNDRIKEVSSPRKFQTADLDRDNDPRMPWHDIGLRIQGRSVIDLKRHFTQYWYFALKDLARPRQFFIDQLQYKLRYEVAKVQENLDADVEYFTRDQELKYYQKRLKKTQSEIKKVQKKEKTSKFRIAIGVNLKTYYTLQIKGWYDHSYISNSTTSSPVKHHLCRSSCNWSMGILQHVEQSIHFAYIQLIRNAQQFIYIQNQFFMGVQHRVFETLIQRIDKAYKNKQSFKVIVMIPLLPGFPGDVNSDEAAVMKIQLYWQYQAIIKGKKAIFNKLKHIKDLWNYIAFLGLRNHGHTLKQKKPITQIIYIHSKLMIVDDRYILIGSANLNDRSMLGSRDSQIAMVTEDSNSKGIAQFRAELFNEHFGLSHHESKNFLKPEKRQKIWDQILETAKKNTLIYRQLFACYPDDMYATFSDIEKNIKTQVQKDLYEKLKGQIKGHVVQNPMMFLEKQDLKFQPLQLEYFAPEKTFT